ncbi:protein tyrosine/serine phosphatase [Pseudomonas chlororaphis subsp. aurantiaca]|nr:protein tyrosine/serine phosphatase [Pseudomonas chlororaphis subsp. aurantiaca]
MPSLAAYRKGRKHRSPGQCLGTAPGSALLQAMLQDANRLADPILGACHDVLKCRATPAGTHRRVLNHPLAI